jgi:NDP-sugar pyrophosphorylase family protein
MRIEISREEELLDTGGGLKKASWFFLDDSAGEPFLLHNVDVLTTIDFTRMIEHHRRQDAIATLAVQTRKTSRQLLFDERDWLCGRQAGEERPPEMARSVTEAHALAFSGVHVISPRFLSVMSQQGAFSIIASYLRAAGQGEKVLAFRADDYYWRDLGKPENIAQAEADISSKLLEL